MINFILGKDEQYPSIPSPHVYLALVLGEGRVSFWTKGQPPDKSPLQDQEECHVTRWMKVEMKKECLHKTTKLINEIAVTK